MKKAMPLNYFAYLNTFLKREWKGKVKAMIDQPDLKSSSSSSSSTTTLKWYEAQPSLALATNDNKLVVDQKKAKKKHLQLGVLRGPGWQCFCWPMTTTPTSQPAIRTWHVMRYDDHLIKKAKNATHHNETSSSGHSASLPAIGHNNVKKKTKIRIILSQVKKMSLKTCF